MNEHESNLFDFYAGLAMLGWMINGDYSEKAIPHMAFDTAKEMIRLRKEKAHEQAAETEGELVPDVAVSDMEGREDSAAQGIAALKKTKARSRST